MAANPKRTARDNALNCESEIEFGSVDASFIRDARESRLTRTRSPTGGVRRGGCASSSRDGRSRFGASQG